MKKFFRFKVLVACLLLGVLALPFAVKSVHLSHACTHHEEHCGSHDAEHPLLPHDCTTCFVCQFSLSTFTEALSFIVDFQDIVSFFQPINFYRSAVYQFVSSSHGLRAPPAV